MTLKQVNEVKKQKFNLFAFKGLQVESEICFEGNQYTFRICSIGFVQNPDKKYVWELINVNGQPTYVSSTEKTEQVKQYNELVRNFVQEMDLQKINLELLNSYKQELKKNEQPVIVEMRYALATEGGVSVTFFNPDKNEFINICNIHDDMIIYMCDVDDVYYHFKSVTNNSMYKKQAKELIKQFKLVKYQDKLEEMLNDLSNYYLKNKSFEEFDEEIPERDAEIEALFKTRPNADVFKKEFMNIVKHYENIYPSFYSIINKEIEKYCKLSVDSVNKLKQIEDLPTTLQEFIQKECNVFESVSNISYATIN